MSNLSMNISNVTSQSPPVVDEVDVILDVVSKLICVVILFVGIFGNSLVLVVFGSRWSRLKSCEIFMISLAFADLIGTIVVPTLQLAETMGGDFKPIGDVGCKLIHFSIMTSITVSSLTLIAITIDRFVIVKWPLRERISFRALRYVVLLTWILGSGPGLIFLIGESVKLYSYQGVHVCRMFLDKQFGPEAGTIHTIITFNIQVAIPLLLLTILYTCIAYELWKTTKTRQFLMREREMRLRYERNKKAIKLLVAIVVMFFLCITPVNTFYILYLFNALTYLRMEDLIRYFIIMQMLQMINSCINPIIYSKLHTSFRRTTLKIFCSCCVEKFRQYQWNTDVGETVKSAMRMTFRYATTTMTMSRQRTVKKRHPVLRKGVPGKSGCANGNINCRKEVPHKQCYNTTKSDNKPTRNGTMTTTISDDSPSSERNHCNARRVSPSSSPFRLTRSEAYKLKCSHPQRAPQEEESTPPQIYIDSYEGEFKGAYHAEVGERNVFLSTSIFKRNSVRFEDEPLIIGGGPKSI